VERALNGPPSPWTRQGVIDYAKPLTAGACDVEEEESIEEELPETFESRLEAEAPPPSSPLDTDLVPEGLASPLPEDPSDALETVIVSEEAQREENQVDNASIVEELRNLTPAVSVTPLTASHGLAREKEPGLWSFCGAFFNCA